MGRELFSEKIGEDVFASYHEAKKFLLAFGYEPIPGSNRDFRLCERHAHIDSRNHVIYNEFNFLNFEAALNYFESIGFEITYQRGERTCELIRDWTHVLIIREYAYIDGNLYLSRHSGESWLKKLGYIDHEGYFYKDGKCFRMSYSSSRYPLCEKREIDCISFRSEKEAVEYLSSQNYHEVARSIDNCLINFIHNDNKDPMVIYKVNDFLWLVRVSFIFITKESAETFCQTIPTKKEPIVIKFSEDSWGISVTMNDGRGIL